MTKSAENPVNSGPAAAARPKLSVVVPCRNERTYIDETIRSIMAQQRVDGRFEVIVVDGESDDGTRERLAELQVSYPDLQVVDNHERTTPYARNRGIEAATGEFIAILDAHTSYAPDYLATCLALLAEHPEADCVGGPIHSTARTTFGKAVAYAMSHPIGVGNARHRFPSFEGFGEGACFPVFRRRVFDRIGLFDTNLVRNQDDEFNYRLKQAGGRVFLSPRARSSYFVRETAGRLFRQYYGYGYWRVRVLRKHGRAASWRQLVPVLFFGGLLVGLPPVFLLGPPWPSVWALLPVAYLLSLALVALLGIRRLGPATALRLPLAVLLMHLAYAAGFVVSLFSSQATAKESSS